MFMMVLFSCNKIDSILYLLVSNISYFLEKLKNNSYVYILSRYLRKPLNELGVNFQKMIKDRTAFNNV